MWYLARKVATKLTAGSGLDKELQRRVRRLKTEEAQLTLMILDQKATLASTEAHLALTQRQIVEIEALRTQAQVPTKAFTL